MKFISWGDKALEHGVSGVVDLNIPGSYFTTRTGWLGVLCRFRDLEVVLPRVGCCRKL